MLTIAVKTKKSTTTQGAFGPITQTTTVEERRPLEAPRRWGMFSSAGNARLRRYAETAMKKVEAARADGFNKKKVEAALVYFVAKWELLGDNDDFGEASDTAVREAVGSFHDKLAEASGVYDYVDYDLWEKTRGRASKRVLELRNKRRGG